MVIQETDDVKSNVKTIVNAEGIETKLTLDANGISLKQLEDPNKSFYKASYTNDKLKNLTYPDGKSESYIYDAYGYLSDVMKRSGEKISFIRDREGFLYEKKLPSNQTTTFQYNKNGLLAKAISKDSTVEIRYDNKNKPISVTYDNKRSLFYKYDSKGRRVSLSDTFGLYHVLYDYDQLGQLITVKQHGNKEILKMTYVNGNVASRVTGDKTTTEYQFSNKTNKLESIESKKYDGKTWQKISYEYDNFGRKKKVTFLDQEWTYGYDSTSQLTTYKDKTGAVTEITYGKIQNRRKTIIGNVETLYVVNNMNQVAKVGSDEYVRYDLNGNLESIENLKLKKEHRFQYDVENKLKFSVNNVQSCSYIYDALGNIKKEICGPTETEYLIDPFGIFGADVIGKVCYELSPSLKV